MADAQTITNELPLVSITVPFYDNSDPYDVQTGERLSKFSENGRNASSGNISRWIEKNPPDRFVEALVYLFLHKPDAIRNEHNSS